MAALTFSAHDIIRRPIITESSMDGINNKVYTFEVVKTATKPQIKTAVEDAFGVEVLSVNTSNVKKKPKRQGIHEGFKQGWKKAVVTLNPKSKPIEFFEGLN